MSVYVYYLFEVATGALLYIGRSQNPAARLKAFERRTGIQVIEGYRQRFSSLPSACEAELAAIKEARPPHNRWLISSAGNAGKTQGVETIAKMRAAHLGKKMSPEARQKMSLAKLGKPAHNKGKQASAETKAKQRAAHLGRPLSAAHRAKLSEVRKGKKCNTPAC